MPEFNKGFFTDLSNAKSMEEFADYVQNLVNSKEITAGLWDFDGVVNLLGALLDNIRSHAVGEDVKALSRMLTPRQATTLLHIARVVQISLTGENSEQR